jgi:hypothetical protein
VRDSFRQNKANAPGAAVIPCGFRAEEIGAYEEDWLWLIICFFMNSVFRLAVLLGTPSGLLSLARNHRNVDPNAMIQLMNKRLAAKTRLFRKALKLAEIRPFLINDTMVKMI